MKLPYGWQTLPGPADFLARIKSDLEIGESVWAYFPHAPANIGTWIRRDLKDWDWQRVSHLSEESSSTLREGVIYWWEVPSDSAQSQQDFRRAVTSVRRAGGSLRICALTRCNDDSEVRALRNAEGIRVRVWSDYVTQTDSRVVVERIGRKEGWPSGYTNLMSAVVSQVVRNDLGRAGEFSMRGLREILDDESLDNGDMWVGQVQVLFPRINFLRQLMIKKYSSLWCVPYHRPESSGSRRTVTEMMELEVSDLSRQSDELTGISERDRKDLREATSIRNRLAHHEVVNWKTLSSDFASRILDIRVPRLEATKTSRVA